MDDAHKTPARIAVIDDEERLATLLGMMLRQDGHAVSVFHNAESFFAADGGEDCDLVLTDLKMPGASGLDVLRHVANKSEDVPVILMTAYGTVDSAIEAMKLGAFDYVQKPFDNALVRATVARALKMTRLARENRRLRDVVRKRYDLDHFVAESPEMIAVMDLARRAARSAATVLVSGDSGTGKELLAKAIHVWSPRVAGPFVPVNCKAFSSGVLESELFGHEKGAFTGAATARSGVFERANGGTLFLDEIGDIDLEFQSKLLRVIQEREVLRVGSDRARPVDVRIVTATHRDLRKRVDEGAFREDLYFRLAVIPIQIPSLADRRSDVLPLARHFLASSSARMGRLMTGWSNEVGAYFAAHTWPGNVRELQNVIERAVALAETDVVQLDDLLLGPQAASVPTGETLQAFVDQQTAVKIRRTLAETDGRRGDTADRLGIERTTLYRLMKKLGISP